MKSSLKSQILEFIKKNKQVRPVDLKRAFHISAVAVHKHLRELLKNREILKLGKPPLVFYAPVSEPETTWSMPPIEDRLRQVIEERYVYISPIGTLLPGLAGFAEWVRGQRLEKQFASLAAEYVKIREEADRFFEVGKNDIEATEKLRRTFSRLYLDKIFYQDFYSLPKFGKTKLGTYVLYAKQSQNLDLIKRIAVASLPVLRSLIERGKIDTIAFLPHSIPRQIPFLREFERFLQLPYPKIEIVKAYTGEIQVPQKSLSKLEERIANARNTFFLKKNSVDARRVLLIDDAVGSGSTMNEVSKMIRDYYKPEWISGFAVVGSYKGFEVIREA